MLALPVNSGNNTVSSNKGNDIDNDSGDGHSSAKNHSSDIRNTNGMNIASNSWHRNNPTHNHHE